MWTSRTRDLDCAADAIDTPPWAASAQTRRHGTPNSWKDDLHKTRYTNKLSVRRSRRDDPRGVRSRLTCAVHGYEEVGRRQA
jgi:hypothetical protein